jgi:hypothetical protein
MWGQRSFPVPPPSWEWTVCRGGAGWYDGGEIQDSFYWREAKRGSWNELARLSPCLNGQKRLLCKVLMLFWVVVPCGLIDGYCFSRAEYGDSMSLQNFGICV